MRLTIALSLILAASVPSYAQVFGKNLIVNGDAEAGPGGDGKTRVASIPGWTSTQGVPDVLAYAVAYTNIHALSPNDIVPYNRGNNYFAGGSAKADSVLAQTIDVSTAAATIDTGTVRYDFSAYMGGFGTDTDSPGLSASFQNTAGTIILNAIIAKGTSDRPPGTNGMYLDRLLGYVPTGTRKITINIVFHYHTGAVNEASVDNIILILTPKSTADVLLHTNLIVNYGADAAPGYNTSLPIPTSADLPNWVRTPYFAADAYTDPGGDLTPTSTGPPDRGANYFYGGNNVANTVTNVESAYQDIDLNSLSDLIDAGADSSNSLLTTISGSMGMLANQGDSPRITVTYFNAAGSQLASYDVPLPAQPSSVTELQSSFSSVQYTPPVGSRTARITIAMTRKNGTADDGLADSVGFAIQKFVPGGCSFSSNNSSFNPPTGAVTSSTITVTPSASTCPWTAYSSDPWIVVTSPASQTGTNTVHFSLAANVGAARNGFITVAGKIFNITQPSFTPSVSVNRTTLNYGYSGALITSPQPVLVSITGGALLNWTATSNAANITVSPASGTGTGSFTVTATPGTSGVVTVAAPGVSNSPLQIQVNVASVTPAAPFGSFDTPADNTSGIAGAIAVSGWALDKIEITSVGLWREKVGSEPVSSNGLVFIGNATLVNDARPDVVTANPTAPLNYRAGWGYLLLTNFLPNTSGTGPLGNGTYKLHVIAVDKSNLTTDLGTRTIIVDNAHANKPFGTIDTPTQGGSASGLQFINFGWALTPTPACIPTDGSTITVTVDGVTLGHPTYNQARSDISSAFPGYCNSNGAVGYFFIDTSTLANGVHTIGWLAYDNQGRGDGLGSRFFNVLNAGATAAPEVPFEFTPLERIGVRRGFDVQSEPEQLRDNRVEIEELGRVEIHAGAVAGYQIVNEERTALPIGSTIQGGVFYWQTAPGFLGEYELVLGRPDGQEIRIQLIIKPKTGTRAEQ